MAEIQLLDQQTIEKIAAGEVVERPSSVVKELVENAIDANATAITIEIKEGGIRLIRITDNGCGIEKSQIQKAFYRHATSKIRSVEDLLDISSLGFRGEALSSIAAVSQMELITKPISPLLGVRYVIEGGKEISIEEMGAPNGTTFLVHNLFYNTPARKKFLKSPATEAGYISDLIERLALSHPDISFTFINNNDTKLHTSGNGKLKDIIYNVFGREVASAMLEIDSCISDFRVTGYIGKPIISRGNRVYENYFINGRYVKSKIVSKAIEDGYKGFLMQHKYPFTALHFTMDGRNLDVNVHPNKMELRFSNEKEVYSVLSELIHNTLSEPELIPEVSVGKENRTEKNTDPLPKIKKGEIPEPFETKRLEKLKEFVKKDSPYQPKYPNMQKKVELLKEASDIIDNQMSDTVRKQMTLSEIGLQTESSADVPQQKLKGTTLQSHRIIGQLFDTYWLIESGDQFFMIDQHAAHEKVLYEQMIAEYHDRHIHSQIISPPVVFTLSMPEEQLLLRYEEQFKNLGFTMEPFGGREYAVTSVPANLYGLSGADVFREIMEELGSISERDTPDLIAEKIASMSCKAAIKGNQVLSGPEIAHLIKELLTLENPYFCPHGRPVIVAMTKYDIEKKFKRIV